MVKFRMPAAVLALLALLLFSSCARAASRPFTAACPSSGAEQVQSREGSQGVYLCLPGAWDASAVVLSCGSHEVLYLGQEKAAVPAGEPADLRPFLGSRVPVFNAKGQSMGTLLILQGAPVLSLHFTVDSRRLSAVNRSKDNSITEGSLTVLEADGTVSYRGGITRFAGRGNSTFAYPKKPYEFKLEGKASLGGIDRGKTWILLANYLDISFLRNQVVLDLCRAVGLRCSVECAPADLWINGDYQGLYLLTEKIQVGKNRVSITDLEEATESVNDQPLRSYARFWDKDSSFPLLLGYEIPNDPEDITGGYIAVVEKRYRMDPGSKPCFRTENNLNVRIKEPTCPSRAQVEYLADLVNRLQLSLLSGGTDPESGLHFSQILDVPSFALKFLVEDLVKNYDFMAGSQYFYKDSDKVDPLIYAGPAWDYDLSCGMMGENPRGAYAARTHTVRGNLWPLLAKQEFFMEAVRQAWQSAFRPALSVLLGESEAPAGSPLRSLSAYRRGIEASAAMDACRRGTSRKVDQQVGKDFASAVDFLASWLSERAASMDELYAR